MLIIVNAVVLTIQAARNINLDSAPVHISGYFHRWEDYALFSLFILFTYVPLISVSYMLPSKL